MIRKLALSTAALGAVATLGMTAPAQAAEQGPAGAHCVGDTDGRLLGCYPSEDAAERSIAGNRGWVPLVKFYDKTGYAGKTLTLGHSSGACSATLGDVDYALPNLGTYGWNNRAGSFVTRNRCDMKGYDGKSYTGDAFRKYQDHDIRLTRWNNDISSFKLS